MLPSIQLSNLPSVTAESFNPDQLNVVMAQLFFSMSQASRIPEALLENIKELNVERREGARLLDSLTGRKDQKSSVVTAESIDVALGNGTSLTPLFGPDPGSLAINLEQAQNLMEDAKNLGVKIDVSLRYPVIVISTDQDGQKEEHLVWMSQAERLSLDAYPIEVDKRYVPYLSRLKEEGSQTTLYVFFDDQANLRIDNGALDNAISQLEELGFQGEANINIEKLRLSTALEGIGSTIRWLIEEIALTFKNKQQTMEEKRERIKEDDEGDRIRTIQFNRLISVLDELIEAKNRADIKNG